MPAKVSTLSAQSSPVDFGIMLLLRQSCTHARRTHARTHEIKLINPNCYNWYNRYRRRTTKKTNRPVETKLCLNDWSKWLRRYNVAMASGCSVKQNDDDQDERCVLAHVNDRSSCGFCLPRCIKNDMKAVYRRNWLLDTASANKSDAPRAEESGSRIHVLYSIFYQTDETATRGSRYRS